MSESTFMDEALAVSHPKKLEPRNPPEWQPHVELNGDTAKAVSKGMETANPDERELIEGWDLDPDEWMIVGDVQCRRWQTYDERWLRYFKANLRRISGGVERADIDALCRLAEKRKPVDPPEAVSGESTAYLSLCDLQLGKTDLNGGTEGTVRHMLWALDRFEKRIKELRKVGRPVEAVCIANNGDLIERISGHYPSQTFTTDLNEREQMRIARRIMFRAIDIAAPLAPKVIVTSTICNHTQVRGSGNKHISDPSDSLGHVIVESVEEATRQNPDRFGHVEFLYAEDYNVVHELSGVRVCANHGHQVRGSGSGASVMNKWWLNQIMGNQPPGQADILITAHRHHFEVSEESGRTLFMCPASDPGSLWYTASSGRSSPRGLLSVCIGGRYERGWGDLELISSREHQ